MGRATTWAAGGGLWGMLSMVPALLPDQYFSLFGFVLGRALRWLLPMWWVVQLDEILGLLVSGRSVPALLAASTLAGAGAALTLWWVLERVRRVNRT